MDKAASAGHSNRCRIVVDTCCDFSPEVAANLDVDSPGFPFHYRWRGAHRRHLVEHEP